MKVLIACEFTGLVRDAFRAKGHDAISCDLDPSERPGPHIQGDVREVLRHDWDMVIASPPCTDLSVSGARWFAEKRANGKQQQAIDFFLMFTKLTCPWAIENPVGVMSTVYRTPDQYIQPFKFGHGETKKTCLWFHCLPRLKPTDEVEGREPRIHRMPPAPNRGKERSRTYPGIAAAMASQWGNQ